jgi:hypothetical protein
MRRGHQITRLPPSLGDVDVEALAAASDGLAGADLKRVVDDGKLLFAFEREKGRLMQPVTAYFLTAVETVRRNKQQYAEAEARARVRHPQRPAFFDPMSAIAAMAMNIEGAAFHVDGPGTLMTGPGPGLAPT